MCDICKLTSVDLCQRLHRDAAETKKLAAQFTREVPAEEDYWTLSQRDGLLKAGFLPPVAVPCEIVAPNERTWQSLPFKKFEPKPQGIKKLAPHRGIELRPLTQVKPQNEKRLQEIHGES